MSSLKKRLKTTKVPFGVLKNFLHLFVHFRCSMQIQKSMHRIGCKVTIKIANLDMSEKIRKPAKTFDA